VHRDVHRRHRQQRGEQLRCQDRSERVGELVGDRGAVEVALVAGHHQEVQRQREHEHDEDQEVVTDLARVQSCGVGDDMEEQTAQEREPRERHKVVAQIVGCLTGAEPSDGNRQHPDHGCRRAAENDGPEHQPEEARRHLDTLRARLDAGHVADDGEERDQHERRRLPAGRACCQDDDNEGRGERYPMDDRERTI
jgi:hypothetical protein